MQPSHRRLRMTIKRLRKKQGLTQEALAKRTGVTREYITRLELGRHDPMFSTLVKLAKALKVNVRELLE